MECPYFIKQCSVCGRLLVAYSGNFKKSSHGKYGWDSKCKQCNKEYREKNKEKLNEQQKKKYQRNKDARHAYQKQYREEHREELNEKNKQYRENNKEKISLKRKQHREEHREEINEKQKQYRKNNPQWDFNHHAKRKFLENVQGDGINREQWLEMMLFFDFRCAYSDEYIGNDSTHRTIDHITALVNGGEHEIWNCVPMYDTYNYSKKDKDMLEWYSEQEFYSIERLNKIHEWQKYAFEKYYNKVVN